MQIKHRNLFRITRFILLKLPAIFKFLSKFRQPQKRLLIIKTDAIGDYILFRNFIEIIKNAEAFKDYQIDLLGNKLWQDIALKYDAGFIGQFFFIEPDDLYEAPLQTLRLGLLLFKNNYQTVLQPTFARTFITDSVAAFTAAKQIIGFDGDAERINPKYKAKTDKFYTQRLIVPQNICFEFDRSKFFFETVLKQPVNLNSPYINIEKAERAGIIVFPGAGVSKRSLEPEKFLALIKLIITQTSHPVYLAGGSGETETGNYLAENLPARSVYNLIGKTSLTQLIDLIGNASLVISNESSAIHIASATKTKSVCILGGGHFGRFAPYPHTMENTPLCIFEQMACYHCNWNCLFNTPESEPFPCVSAISVQKVWQAVERLLPEGTV
jgi:ADP-heptose:LPS heptosyltransferase